MESEQTLIRGREARIPNASNHLIEYRNINKNIPEYPHYQPHDQEGS